MLHDWLPWGETDGTVWDDINQKFMDMGPPIQVARNLLKREDPLAPVVLHELAKVLREIADYVDEEAVNLEK